MIFGAFALCSRRAGVIVTRLDGHIHAEVDGKPFLDFHYAMTPQTLLAPSKIRQWQDCYAQFSDGKYSQESLCPSRERVSLVKLRDATEGNHEIVSFRGADILPAV
jgi:hypothetical protein